MTFLYDIGRVLLDFDFEGSLSKLLPADCENPHERLLRLLERKDELESGAIPADEYIAWALDMLGSSATHDEFRHTWRNIFTPNEPMWEHVRRFAAAGHNLVLFSNINSIHSPWIYDEFPQFHLFHGAVMSFETGYIKPQPQIYQHAIDHHGLVPEETLYIDDLPQNIEGGRAFGFHCHQYDLKNHAAFEKWLASFPI